MGNIAIIGDRTTTTTLSLAVACDQAEPRPVRQHEETHDGRPLVVEVDPSGGSLAAWLDMPVNPSLSTIVAQGSAVDIDTLEPLIRTGPHGLRIVPAPVRSREASRAVDEASRGLLQALATDPTRTTLLDAGHLVPAHGIPATIHGATAIVLCHRQEAASARAAAVRLERLGESVELLAHLDRPLTIALIGDKPYGGGEVLEYLLSDGSRIATATAVPTLIALPDDPLCAAVLAGRVGVSARRLARLPLMRAARTLVAHLRAFDPEIATGGRNESPGRASTSAAPPPAPTTERSGP